LIKHQRRSTSRPTQQSHETKKLQPAIAIFILRTGSFIPALAICQRMKRFNGFCPELLLNNRADIIARIFPGS
jgi:hypothetical protein